MLFFAPLFALAATPLSEPLPRTTSPRAAIASAHCATLRVDAHPRGRIALASRICLRPGDEDVVEERGFIDLDRARFTFERTPFGAPTDESWPPSCKALVDERAHDAIASDAVSRVLRDPRVAPCFLAHAAGPSVDDREHPLWRWSGHLDDENQATPEGHPLLSWSKSGRFVAVHFVTDDWRRDFMEVESVVVDTGTLQAQHNEGSGIYVPRFVRGGVAEVVLLNVDGVESWRADFSRPNSAMQRGLALTYGEVAGLSGACDADDVDSPEVTNVDVTTFRGFFDKAACRREARATDEARGD